MNNSKKKMEILTGAAKCVTTVALCGMIVGSCAFRVASIECNVNHSTNAICPITRLETFLFGAEAGLRHQARDLERYSVNYQDHKEYTSDVVYQSGSDETFPQVTYNEVSLYDDTTEVEAKGWAYVDGQFVQYTEENLELKKRMK